MPSYYTKLQCLCPIWSSHSGNWRLLSSREWLWRILLPPMKMEPHPTKQLPSKFHSENYKWTVNLIWKLCKITSSAHASVYIIYITFIHPRQIYCSTLYTIQTTDAYPHAHTNHLFLYVIWSFHGNYMKQSLLRGSAMQWWSSETVRYSLSLQLDVITGYITGINTACGHIIRHTNSWWKRQRQSLKCWTHIPLHRLIAQDFTKFVSRWQFKAYIYIYLLLFGNIHWTRVFFLTHAICIKLPWILFTVNILLNYILLCVSLFTLTYTTLTHSFIYISVASTSVRSVINLFHSSSYQHSCNYFHPKISVLQQNDSHMTEDMLHIRSSTSFISLHWLPLS